MSTLGDHLWNQFGGDVPSDPASVAREAIQRYGSGRAAARELGIDEKTIRRWKTGETMRSEHVDRYAKTARQAQVEARSGPVEVKFRYAKRDRSLRFTPGQGGSKGMRPGAADRIRDAYVRGDRETMAKAFVDGVADPWYRGMLSRSHEAELEGAESGEAGEDSSSVGVFVA